MSSDQQRLTVLLLALCALLGVWVVSGASLMPLGGLLVDLLTLDVVSALPAIAILAVLIALVAMARRRVRRVP